MYNLDKVWHKLQRRYPGIEEILTEENLVYIKSFNDKEMLKRFGTFLRQAYVRYQACKLQKEVHELNEMFQKGKRPGHNYTIDKLIREIEKDCKGWP